MNNLKINYKDLISLDSIVNLSTEKALDHIGKLTDISFYLKKTEGLKHSIKLNEELQKRELSASEMSTAHYYMGNAWADIKKLLTEDKKKIWEWEQKETEKEIIHYRKALCKDVLIHLPTPMKHQILINLGNVMSNIGRFVEALGYWDGVIEKFPSNAMALGNKGYGLSFYADALYDIKHKIIFFQKALEFLKKSTKYPLRPEAKEIFENQIKLIESSIPPKYLKKKIKLNDFSLGKSRSEIEYRKWCLENRLFLNPLNDLGLYKISAKDILTTPNIVVGIDEGPYYPGFFNQIKQEFVSARYLYYKGINVDKPHFSDHCVLLYNTLDYPVYSLSIEKIKSAFRTTYSIFDKIAFFLNRYLNFSIPPKKVKFRTFWYKSTEKKKGLNDELKNLKNWPLRGLYWLSKDLFEDQKGFIESLEPDAKELSDIRNHLEHKYLKVHDDIWAGEPKELDGLTDTLAYSIYRSDFEAKTLKLMKMARAALIYMSLTIHKEELQRAKRRNEERKNITGETIQIEMPLDIWEDEWKI